MSATKKLFVSLSLTAVLALTASCSTGSKVSDKADPFPRSMLGHTTFKVFKEGTPKEYLGRTFRNESVQILAEKMWDGKTLGDKRGQRREIEYSRQSSFSLEARIPKLQLKAGARGDLTFKMVLIGLKVHNLTRPVMLSDFRSDEDAKKTKFIVSVLHAESIVLKVQDKTGADIKLDGAANDVVANTGYKYSDKHKGLVVANNAFIGYYLTKPRASDLNRR